MIDLLLVKDGACTDISIVNGIPQMVEGDDELVQRVRLKLQFFQNDWFLDLLFGVPYYGRVFQKGVNIDDLYGVFTLAIEEEPGVAYVQELDINLDARKREIAVSGVALSDVGARFAISSGSVI